MPFGAWVAALGLRFEAGRILAGAAFAAGGETLRDGGVDFGVDFGPGRDVVLVMAFDCLIPDRLPSKAGNDVLT